MSDTPLLYSMASLLANSKFIDHLLMIIEKKLESIGENQGGDRSYDPETHNSTELFNVLSSMWIGFCQRINAPDTSISNTHSTFYKPDLSQKFQDPFFAKTHRYIRLCQIIWSIVSRRFERKTDTLIGNERAHYAPHDFDVERSMTKSDQTKLANLCWKFVVNCMRTVQTHRMSKSNIATWTPRIVESLLALIADILEPISIEKKRSELLTAWLYKLAESELAKDTRVGHQLFKLLFLVGSKTSSRHRVAQELAAQINDASKPNSDYFLRLFTTQNINEYYRLIGEQIERKLHIYYLPQLITYTDERSPK